MEPARIEVLRDAVWHNPRNVGLRLQLVTELMQLGLWQEAMRHCVQVVSADPANVDALNAMHTITGALQAPPEQPAAPPDRGYDWAAAEADVEGIVEPAYLEPRHTPTPPAVSGRRETVMTTLADVAGMDEVKRQIDASFLAPLRNPAIAEAYGVRAGGGLCLYGPPGCGKTYLASAIAGEIGASFFPVGITEILDKYIGESEANLHTKFEAARRAAPSVVFVDELDALGQTRTRSHAAAIVNQLLLETDSSSGANDGVFLVGATNLPWDVDPALRRPGRFDRLVFVPPPDAEAREAIIRSNFDKAPIAGVDLHAFVTRTEGFSGADVVQVCKDAARFAMTDAIEDGQLRHITDEDVRDALAEITPSVEPWFTKARLVVEFGNNDGTFDELARYMRQGRTTTRKRRWGRQR